MGSRLWPGVVKGVLRGEDDGGNYGEGEILVLACGLGCYWGVVDMGLPVASAGPCLDSCQPLGLDNWFL